MTATREAPPIEQYERLIYQHANFCYRRLPCGHAIDLEDLCQECGRVYAECVGLWQPGRGAFITLFVLRMRHALARVLDREHRHHRVQPSPSDMGEGAQSDGLFEEPEAPEDDDAPLPDMFERRISSDAYRFVRELLDPSDGFLAWHQSRYGTTARSPMLLRGRIARYFGWNNAKTNRVAAELSRALPQERVKTWTNRMAAATSLVRAKRPEEVLPTGQGGEIAPRGGFGGVGEVG